MAVMGAGTGASVLLATVHSVKGWGCALGAVRPLVCTPRSVLRRSKLVSVLLHDLTAHQQNEQSCCTGIFLTTSSTLKHFASTAPRPRASGPNG